MHLQWGCQFDRNNSTGEGDGERTGVNGFSCIVHGFNLDVLTALCFTGKAKGKYFNK